MIRHITFVYLICRWALVALCAYFGLYVHYFPAFFGYFCLFMLFALLLWFML